MTIHPVTEVSGHLTGNSPLTFIFKRSVHDERTFDQFTGIRVDGREVERIDSNYTVKTGSVVISLQPEYLKTLPGGAHTLTAVFEGDRTVTGSFTITKPDPKPEPSPDPEPEPKPEPAPAETPEPKTESEEAERTDRELPVDSVVTCQMAGYPEGYAWNEAAKACQPGYLDENGVFHASARRRRVPDTSDSGLLRQTLTLCFSAVTACVSAYLLRTH